MANPRLYRNSINSFYIYHLRRDRRGARRQRRANQRVAVEVFGVGANGRFKRAVRVGDRASTRFCEESQTHGQQCWGVTCS